MQNLLPYYERELAQLRQASTVFAQRYPKIAGRLKLAGDVSDDPHAERLIESFALLTARINKRLDDDFPLFTASMLEVLYPHYLQPFPSCSIAQFDLGSAEGQLSAPTVLPKGTLVRSRPVQGVTCRFKTTQAVDLLPVRLVEAQFRHAVGAPDGTPLPKGVTSVLSLTLDLTSPMVSLAAVFQKPLRFYLDGEAAQVSVLRDVLCRKVVDVLVQTEEHHPWRRANMAAHASAPALRPLPVGFESEQALIEGDARSHDAYRLLTEYFSFPEKFNFVDIPVPMLTEWQRAKGSTDDSARATQRVRIKLLIAGVRSDSDEARLLDMVDANNFALGCAPVINLFEQPADPILVSHKQESYPLVVDGRRAHGYEVHSIRKAFRVKRAADGERVDEIRPFFSLKHEASMDEAYRPAHEASHPCYWTMQRHEELAEQSPGYETHLSFVDPQFNPATPQVDTLSVTVMATNRDLPAHLPVGAQGGDLFMDGGSVAKEIRLLKKPSLTRRLQRDQGALWRLISHLSMNLLSLSSVGVDGLREMLRLYDLSQSASNRKQINGLVGVTYAPATAWLPGEPFACFVRGTEVRLDIDEEGFVGSGLGLFVAVLDRFFGHYAHANSFTKLTVVSTRSQEVVMSCPSRSGAIQLV
jgi:type VI secretion system protein ImpG